MVNRNALLIALFALPRIAIHAQNITGSIVGPLRQSR
jgi:hypothetical protein